MRNVLIIEDDSGAIAPRVAEMMLTLSRSPQVEIPVTHEFKRLGERAVYLRHAVGPAQTIVISKLHKTSHPFFISRGRCSVWSERGGVVHLRGPHRGITTPGTRRILYFHEDTHWTTVHRVPETVTLTGDVESDVAAIEAAIIEREPVDELVQANILAQLKEAA